MNIPGIEHLTLEELDAKLAAGSRFVYYEFCISLIIPVLRCPSRVYFLRPDELGLLRGLPYTVVSLLLGWWGIPWGIIYTPLTILTNISGGRDVTPAIRALLPRPSANSPGAPA